MVVALSGAISGCAKHIDAAQSNTKPIRIGAILSLSGTYAALGEPERNALRLLESQVNAKGGVNGRPIEIIIEDDGTDEAKAVAAAQKLIERDNVVAILGASGTGPSMAVRGVVETAGIPQISLAGGSVITSKFSPNVFQIPWQNSLLINELLSQLKSKGITKVALISDNGGYGKDGHEILAKSVAKYGITAVADVAFKPGDTDMSGQISAIARSDAQAVILWNAGKEASIVLKTAYQQGLTIPWYGGSGQARAEFIEGAGSVAENYTIITGKSYLPQLWENQDSQRQMVESFLANYKATYKKDPDIFAGHAHDGLALLIDALGRSSSTDGKSLIAALNETTNVIGYGGSFSFTAKNHNGLSVKDVGFMHISKGAWAPGIAATTSSQVAISPVSQAVQTVIGGLSNGFIYALIGLGIVVIYLSTGTINFAHGELVAWPGLIAAAIVALSLPAVVAWPLAILCGPILGALLYLFFLRPLGNGGGVRTIMITIGLSVALRQLALRLMGPNELSLSNPFGSSMVVFAGLRLSPLALLGSLVSIVALGVFAYAYKKSKFGFAMQANAQNPEGALLVGVQPNKVGMSAWAIAGLMAAIAGVLLVPQSQMSFDSGLIYGIKGFTVAVIGGLANPLGALVGGLLIGVLESLTAAYVHPVLKDALVVIVLLVTLIVKPSGILGSKDKEKL